MPPTSDSDACVHGHVGEWWTDGDRRVCRACRRAGVRAARARPPARSRRYKRVWMRAARRGVSFDAYCRANLDAYRRGGPHDAEVLEVYGLHRERRAS